MAIKSIFRNILLALVFCIVTGAFALIAYVMYKSHDPIYKLESLLVGPDKHIHKAFFSPDDPIKHTLIKLINSEKKRVICAAYIITENDIAQAFIDARNRGVEVEIITDRAYGSDKFSRIPMLANNKINIWVFQTSGNEKQAALMHNKFCVFEDNILHKAILWTGSYNFTKKASTVNQENVIILDNPELIERFIKQFDTLKARSLAISGNFVGEFRKKVVEDKPFWWESLWHLLPGWK